MPSLQDSIHKLEEGGGMRFVRVALAVLVVLVLAMVYDWRCYRGMASLEAMDAAQVGRNLAEGKGFSTLCVRPFSIFLLKRHVRETGQVTADPGRLKEPHPDLANPPLYPAVLAGLMKILPFNYVLPIKPHRFWGGGFGFQRYQPEFLITLLNQVLFIFSVVLVFRLARKLFDAPVAWLSAVLMLLTDVFWRFSTSGLSTMLVMVWFLLLAWVLVLIEQEGREARRGLAMQLGLAVVAGLLVGLGALTRYAFGWLIVPVVLFLFLFGGPRRAAMGVVAFIVFAAALTPWLARNYGLSGTPFGTAGYAVVEMTGPFSEHRLMRSLDPEFNQLYPRLFWAKLLLNGRQILTEELPRLGGNWLAGFFLAGLLIRFRNPAITRLRFFLLGSLAVWIVAQALGRTQLSQDSVEINSENLLVILFPLVIVFGVSLFLLLLDQLSLTLRPVRYLIVGTFGVLASLAMVFTLLPPRKTPVVYPPYFPPIIQEATGWLRPTETVMSDVPWATAWYGRRQSIWLTLTVQGDFFAVHDYQKPIALLFFTPVTMNGGFLNHWLRAPDNAWEKVVISAVGGRELPVSFPLNKLYRPYWPEHLILSDWERWNQSRPAAASSGP